MDRAKLKVDVNSLWVVELKYFSKYLEAEEIKACKTLQVVADIVDPNFMG